MHISDNYVNTLELATLLVHTDTLTCTHLICMYMYVIKVVVFFF